MNFFNNKKDKQQKENENSRFSANNNLSTENEILEITFEDMLSEAQVYWTYNKFQDAYNIYSIWLSMNGLGTPFNNDNKENQIDIATKCIDCTLQLKNFSLSEDILNLLETSLYPEEFIAKQCLICLKHDPSNFNFIEMANKYIKDADLIENIIQKESIRIDSFVEKRKKLWRKNSTDAALIAAKEEKKISRLNWNFSNRGVDLLRYIIKNSNDDDALRFSSIALVEIKMTPEEARIIGNMAGTGLMEDDDAGGLDPVFNQDLYNSIIESMKKEVLSNPKNISIQVEMLKIFHNECDLHEYIQWFFYLSVVLHYYKSGEKLRKRLLSIGKLLGTHAAWDYLSLNLNYEILKMLAYKYNFVTPSNIFYLIENSSDLLIEKR